VLPVAYPVAAWVSALVGVWLALVVSLPAYQVAAWVSALAGVSPVVLLVRKERYRQS
jgi:hypothetical protein